MDSFNFDNLSTSVNAQLNQGIQSARKINSHLQTGKRVYEAKDYAAAFSVSSKINSDFKQKTQRAQNLYNSISILHLQVFAFESAGKIFMMM